MPELPEVESIKRELNRTILEEKIEDVEIFRGSVIKNTHADYLRAVMAGNSFTWVGRRGKYLLLSLSSGHLLVVHLGMTGQLYWQEAALALKKHSHLVWHLKGGISLIYRDVRRFGKIFLLEDGRTDSIPGLLKMGPEPLDPAFSLADWLALFEGAGSSPIKAKLLDQHFIAGIGNIYADETLYEARINPHRPVKSLTRAEKTALYGAMRRVLKRAIEEGGSSISDYVNARGQKGGFQDSHRVYGKKDQPCPTCKQPLRSSKIVGRTSSYCPFCQL